MSQPWKLLPFAAILVAIGALIVAPGGASRPDSASAYLCGSNQTGTLIIQILDDNTGNPVTVAGSVVSMTPNPSSGSGATIFVDNSGGDTDNDPGVIEILGACSTEGAEDYEVTLTGLPNALDDCTIEDDFDIDDLAPDQTANLILNVDCSALATATPQATATATPNPAGPADSITVSASPQTVSCSGTSIITIQVRDKDDDPVPPGTAINVTSTLGSISPSAGTTADDSGDGFLFFTAGADKGGKAVITATSGNATGSTEVTVNCGAAPTATTAPQPTATTGGVISPPNTGSAGLADADSTSWVAFAATAIASTISLAFVAAARARA